jgi:glutaredoxin-related protein
MGPKGVLIEKKYVVVMKWTLDMQECGLSISLQQLKMKVAKLTQIKDTPFRNGILSNSWWDSFKQIHLEENI